MGWACSVRIDAYGARGRAGQALSTIHVGTRAGLGALYEKSGIAGREAGQCGIWVCFLTGPDALGCRPLERSNAILREDHMIGIRAFGLGLAALLAVSGSALAQSYPTQ